MAKAVSRRKGAGWTLKGATSAIEPTTTEMMKVAAPRSSPIAREPELEEKAE